jgi:hypothetical protein
MIKTDRRETMETEITIKIVTSAWVQTTKTAEPDLDRSQRALRQLSLGIACLPKISTNKQEKR